MLNPSCIRRYMCSIAWYSVFFIKYRLVSQSSADTDPGLNGCLHSKSYLHHARSSNSSILWWASGGPNSHLSFSDFKSKYLMTNFTSSITRTGSTMGAFTSSATSSRKLHGIPSDVNWVTAGIVPPVRDQKQCGATICVVACIFQGLYMQLVQLI